MEAKGAAGAESSAHLTRQVDIVLACLPDVPTVEEVFLGKDGIVSAAGPGQLLVDHRTVGPSTSRKIHKAARLRGAFFLDAPISRGPEGATAGTLAIMVGGDAQAFQNARSVFEAMGRTVVHMGSTGAGAVTKLVNPLLVGIHILSSCEARLLGARAGVDLEKLAKVLHHSWGDSRMLERNAPHIIKGEFGPSGSPLRNMVKDMAIVRKFAKELRVPLPTGRAADKLFAAAGKRGLAMQDIAALSLLLERNEV